MGMSWEGVWDGWLHHWDWNGKSLVGTNLISICFQINCGLLYTFSGCNGSCSNIAYLGNFSPKKSLISVFTVASLRFHSSAMWTSAVWLNVYHQIVLDFEQQTLQCTCLLQWVKAVYSLGCFWGVLHLPIVQMYPPISVSEAAAPPIRMMACM